MTAAQFPRDAECAKGHYPPLWDDGAPEDEPAREPDAVRDRRHSEAKRICWDVCPVRAACSVAALEEYGSPHPPSGVRGGHVLPTFQSRWKGQQGASARDSELHRLLTIGVPLDEAAPMADRMFGRRRRGPRRREAC